MILSLPSLPRITIWFQAKEGGRRLPEHLAPGFDDSCRYLEYKPSEDFIFLIQTEQKADTLPQSLAFLFEIDGQDIAYFPVCGPNGFMASERPGGSQTISVRQDFAEGNQKIKFRFPKSGALGQIIVRVFALKHLQVIPSFPKDFNVYKWRHTTRNIRQYRILNDSEVRALKPQKGLEKILFKHIEEEPVAVFRFKHRTSEQLKELAVNQHSAPAILHQKPLANLDINVPPQPTKQASPKTLISLPNSRLFQITAEKSALPVEKLPIKPPEPIQSKAVNPPPSTPQSSAHIERNEPGDSSLARAESESIQSKAARLTRLEYYRKELAALKQKLGRSEESSAQTVFDEHGRPCQPIVETQRRGPSDMRRRPTPVDEESYTPPAVPRFGSITQAVKETPAQFENMNALEPPAGVLTGPAFTQHVAWGQFGQILQKVPSWAPSLGTLQTKTWASTWAAEMTPPPIRWFGQENVSLTVDHSRAARQGEECKGVKRKRERDGESIDGETVIERPARKMCVGQ